MKAQTSSDLDAAVWGPYANFHDIARFQYGRLLWRNARSRARLIGHWTDARHPYRDRFFAQRELLEETLSSDESPAVLDQRLRLKNTSLRSLAREIPPVFGSFWIPIRRAEDDKAAG